MQKHRNHSPNITKGQERMYWLNDQTKNVSKEKPVFIKASIKNKYEEKPYWKGIMACYKQEKVKVEDDYYCEMKDAVVAMVINEGKSLNDRQSLHPTNRIWLTDENVADLEILETTPQLMSQYRHAKNNIKATARICDYEYGVPSENCQVVNGTQREIDIPNVRTIDEAQAYIFKNHPAQYLGCSISINTGDFMATAYPGYYKYDKTADYKTREGREQIVKKLAKEEGCEVGEFSYELLDKVLEEREKAQKTPNAEQERQTENNQPSIS